MKHQDQKQCAGVWIDQKQAIVISKESGEFIVTNKIESPGQFQSHSELHRDNAKHADTIAYFKSVSALLQSYDKLLIFGTGKSQEQLHNYLNEDTKFGDKKIAVENTPHLTDNQMLSLVRDFFK